MWPPDALEFLRDLEDNNDRDWFKANRARYEEHLRAAAAALGEDLSDLGRPRLFRPWNDTRFRPGPPIKEQVGLAIGYEGAGGFYVELSLDGLLVAAGLHNPTPDQVERLRLKNLTVFRRHALAPWLHTAECDERVRGELESSRPLVEWLRGTISRAASA